MLKVHTWQARLMPKVRLNCKGCISRMQMLD